MQKYTDYAEIQRGWKGDLSEGGYTGGKHLEYHRMLNNPSLQVKLEEALTLAMEFHNSLQDFINWLTQAEQTLNVASRPSLILDTVLFQIDEHKVKLQPWCRVLNSQTFLDTRLF